MYDLDTSRVKVNHHAKYLGQRSFHSNRLLYTATKVFGNNNNKTRNPLTLPGVPQTNETISTANGPKFTILWGHVGEILLLNKLFFRLSIHALVAKI